MSIITIFEKIALEAHHKVKINQLLIGQSAAIQDAFLKNDADFIKAQLNGTNLLADRTTIFQRNNDTCTMPL